MSNKKKQPDGIDLLCLELYGRKSVPADWMSGHNGKMLFDAASKIEALKSLVSMVREALLVGKDPDYFSDHASMEDAVTKAQELLKSEFSRRAMDDDRRPPREADIEKALSDAKHEISRLRAELEASSKSESEAKVTIESGIEDDPGGSGLMTVVASVDGFTVASASADESHMSNARVMFGKDSVAVCDELKSALLNHLRGVLKRFTVVDCRPGTLEGVWIGRILIMQSDHIEPHCVSYDFSTGETGPESMCEVARDAFRRHVHETVMRKIGWQIR